MSSSPKQEGVSIILIQVLVAFLTLITVVLLFAFLRIPSQTNEFAVALIVFVAWFLVISVVVSLFQKRPISPGPERTR